MVTALIGTLKDHWHLSSPLPLLAALALGVVLLYWRRGARWGRWWLTVVVLGYWALSTPAIAWLVAWPLAHQYRRLESRAEASNAEAVVVLGGGVRTRMDGPLALDDLGGSALRVMEGVRVYRLLGDPVLIVSGGDSEHRDPPRPEAAALAAAAASLGVRPSRIILEDKGLTTREEALAVKRILDDRHIARFVVVTDAVHLRRSLATFRNVGLDPVASPSLAADADRHVFALAPSRDSLGRSDEAIYEYVALVYYWSRGWITAPRR